MYICMSVIIPDPPTTMDNIKMIQYPLINKNKPAFAIILNNKKFDYLGERKGTDKDESTIYSLKEKLDGMIKFHEYTLKDLKADEIIGAFKMLAQHNLNSLGNTEIDGALKLFGKDKQLTSFIEKMKECLKCRPIDFTKYSCFMAFILSHGDEKGIAGKDYHNDTNLVKVDMLSSYFTPNQCEGLKNKPKIFFIQACRGSQRDVLPTMDDTSYKPLTEGMSIYAHLANILNQACAWFLKLLLYMMSVCVCICVFVVVCVCVSLLCVYVAYGKNFDEGNADKFDKFPEIRQYYPYKNFPFS